jgi:hypothetical protein
LQLDARAGLQVSRRQPEQCAAPLEMVERLVHRGLDVIQAGRDLGFEMA